MDGMIYHVFTKSIEGLRIFSDPLEYWRMQQCLWYYRVAALKMSLSQFILVGNESIVDEIVCSKRDERLVDIIAYCLMPNHLHLILIAICKEGITKYMAKILNSYSRYFNIKHDRKGPLWQSRFKRVEVVSDEQLQHLTRYVHLNPVTAHLVNKPEDWSASSYHEYLGNVEDRKRICTFEDFIDVDIEEYRTFVKTGIVYQREMAKLKKTDWNIPT